MLRGEPVRGKYYIVRTFDSKGRPEGASICKYVNREGRGCQLHGDRLGYTYHFEKFGGGISSVWVNFPEGEKDATKLYGQLGERVALYEGTIDPWDFTQLPEKKTLAAV
jgi:hypothetical protein